jgi:ATP adenylyltransferase
MNYLWSPWRKSYISGQEKSSECIFCEAARLEDNPENLIVYRDARSFVILNRFPYTNAHLMVVPFSHQPSIEFLDAATRSEMFELVNRAVLVLRAEYHPEAFNIGINVGAAAGAGVTDHVHIHVVPRWSGDTNFMTSVGETRVLPEDLAETYQRMVDRWKMI